MWASVVVTCSLSCPMAFRILVPASRIKPTSSALAGEFLTAGPPEKSLSGFLILRCHPLLFSGVFSREDQLGYPVVTNVSS